MTFWSTQTQAFPIRPNLVWSFLSYFFFLSTPQAILNLDEKTCRRHKMRWMSLKLPFQGFSFPSFLFFCISSHPPPLIFAFSLPDLFLSGFSSPSHLIRRCLGNQTAPFLSSFFFHPKDDAVINEKYRLEFFCFCPVCCHCQMESDKLLLHLYTSLSKASVFVTSAVYRYCSKTAWYASL